MVTEITDLKGKDLEEDLKQNGWRLHFSRASDGDKDSIWVYLPDGIESDDFAEWKLEMKKRHPGFFGPADSYGNLAQQYRWVKEVH